MRTLNRRLHVVRTGLGRSAALVASLSGTCAAALAGLVVALVLLPPALVLPAAALALMLAAATLAILAWAPGEVGGARLVLWDTAGALTLIGLCAALFGEAEAVALIERDR